MTEARWAAVRARQTQRGACVRLALGALLWGLPATAAPQPVDGETGPTSRRVAVETPAPAVHRDVAVFGGYAWSRPSLDDVHLSLGDALDAWVAGVRLPISQHLTVVGEVEGAYGAQFSTGIVVRPMGTGRSSLYALEAGPRYRPTDGRVAPYAEALVGMVHGQARSMGVDFLQAVTDTAVEVGGGAGIDVRLTPSLAFGAGVEYQRSNLFGQRLSRVRVVSTVAWIM